MPTLLHTEGGALSAAGCALSRLDAAADLGDDTDLVEDGETCRPAS